VVEEVATQYAGRLTVGKLNVDEHPAVAQRSGITSIPALVFFHEGQVRETIVGAVPQGVLRARVDEVLRRTAARGPAQRTASRSYGGGRMRLGCVECGASGKLVA